MTDDELSDLAMQPDPELEAELERMEADDPKLRAIGDRLRDAEAALRGQPSRLGTHLRSLRRMRKARMKWRSPGSDFGGPSDG